jgi:hypothetical protein
MQYRSVAQIAGEADVLELPRLSRQARLERWAEALARRPGRLRAIPDVEHGGRRERAARRADGSPLTVAYEDPVLRAAGLRGDTIGDAAAFFRRRGRVLRPVARAAAPPGLLLPPRADDGPSGHRRGGPRPDAARGGVRGLDHRPRRGGGVLRRAHGRRGARGRALLMPGESGLAARDGRRHHDKLRKSLLRLPHGDPHLSTTRIVAS